MKHTLLSILVILFCSSLIAQNNAPISQIKRVEYVYDNAGNRYYRYILYLPLKLTDTTNNGGNGEATNGTQPTDDNTYGQTLGSMKINVFPNPTQGQLNIQVSNLPEGSSGSLLLVDQTGRTIMTQNQIKPSQKMDLSGLGKGIYFLQVMMGTQKKEWKIVRE